MTYDVDHPEGLPGLDYMAREDLSEEMTFSRYVWLKKSTSPS